MLLQFTSFPFDCQMLDLSLHCRCENEAFLQTVTHCIQNYARDPAEFTSAYNQVASMYKAQGGKS